MDALRTDLAALLTRRLERLPHIRRWVIAFSGGVDSRVLLELCARTLPRENLLALHIDHQLQSASAQWAKWCEAQCALLGIAFQCIRVDPGKGSEAELRSARYAGFASVLKQGDCLLLAQHADDQTETLLLRLVRGAGVRGLAGMPERRAFGEGQLLRPLLDLPRSRLEAWARQEGLDWIDDPSNADDRYDRNWIRHHLIGPLRTRWPRLNERVTATTRQLAEAGALLAELADSDLAAIGRWPERLPLDTMAPLSKPRQRNLLRHWVHRVSGHWLTADELARVERQVIAAGEDRTPALQLGDFWLRRYRTELYLLPSLPDPEPPFGLVSAQREWALTQGCLAFADRGGVGLAAGVPLRVAYRRGGERLKPHGRGGSVGLKQLLQEAGIPPWWRANWPLLYCDNEIVAVPGVCLCEGWIAEAGLVPLWQPLGLSDGDCFGRL